MNVLEYEKDMRILKRLQQDLKIIAKQIKEEYS